MHNENGTYTTVYRNIRYPRLELKTGTLILILPKDYTKEKQLLEKHQKWITQKQQIIQTALKQAETTQLDESRTLQELKALTKTIVQQTESELETKINRIFYRKMKTKWASYSKNKNLTINTSTRHLPQNLIRYIIYHELTHAKERKHNSTFWTLVSKKHPNHKSLETQLLTHWFLIQKTQTLSCSEPPIRNSSKQ
jgi:hypothetical protein